MMLFHQLHQLKTHCNADTNILLSHFFFSRSGSYHSKYPFCVRYYMRLRNKVCYLSMNASLKSYIHTCVMKRLWMYFGTNPR